jgi:phosphoglycerol transferase MdoB-like AlkP superfamily enzyme
MSAPSRSRSFSLDIAPLCATVLLVWIKLVGFNLALDLGRDMQQPIQVWAWLHTSLFTSTLALLLLVCTPLLLLPRIQRLVLLLLLNFALTTMVFVNLIHFASYGEVVSVWSSPTARMLGSIIPSILSLARPAYLLLYADILVGGLLLLRYARHVHTAPRGERWLLVRPFVVATGVALLLASPGLRLVAQVRTESLSSLFWQREVVANVGLLPYHLLDLHSFFAYYGGHSVTEEDQQRARAYLIEHRRNSARSSLFGTAANRNVILILAESFQTFLLGLEVNGQPITPHITRLANESIYFENVHDQTHLGTTSDGELVALQGLHPSALGEVAFGYADNDFYGLPAILAGRGYTTISAHAAPADFWNMHKMHPNYGIQRSYFEDSYAVNERIGQWMADREFFQQTAPRLQAFAEPFFAFLLSASNHHPYKLPAQRYVLDLGELEGTLLGDYLHTAHYFDSALGEFVDGLRASGLLDRSVLAIFGDHHALLGSSPELAQLLGYSHEDAFRHFVTRKKVPLIIRLPHGDHAGVRSVTGGQVDIAPTLLGLLGIDDPSRVMLGQDLTAERHSLVVFRDGSFADGEHYFVGRLGSVASATCYRAETGSPIPCAELEERYREALERLEISDLILRGNLISQWRSE